MAAQMRIDLDVKWQSAVTGLNAVARRLDTISQRMMTLQTQINSMGAGPVGGGGGGRGASGGGAGNRTQMIQLMKGPWAGLLKARQNLMLAFQMGTAEEIADAQILLQQAHARLARSNRQPASFGQRLLQLVGTTRWTPGQGVAPLLNRIGMLFAPGRGAAGGGASGLAGGATGALAGGAIAIGVSAAIGAMHLLKAAFDEATATVGRFNQTMMTSGGTPRQTAFLDRLGIGADAAASFRQQLSTDPIAGAAGRKLGLGVQLPRPFGKVNEAEKLQQALIALSQITNEEERLDQARRLGLDGYMKEIEMIRNHKAEMLREAAIRGAVGGAASKSFIEFEYQMTRLKQTLSLAAVVGITPLIQSINEMFNALKVAGVVLDSLMPPWLKTLLLPGAGASQQQATNANTQAVNNNTAVLRQGMYGGGARLRGALPRSVNGYYFEMGGDAQALTRGAFSL